MKALQLLAAATIALLGSGCTETQRPGPDIETDPSSPTSPLVLIDLNWTHTNPPGGTPMELEVARFELSDQYHRLEVVFEQVQRPAYRAFADNGRAYGPNNTFDQGAFQNNQTPGEVHLAFTQPILGEWRLTFLTDQAQPLGEHQLHVTATAFP